MQTQNPNQMRKNETPVNGDGYHAEICPSHMAKDQELRKLFRPGKVFYYLETVEIMDDMVIIAVEDREQRIIPVPISKLKLSVNQFDEILVKYPEVYRHYSKMVGRAKGTGSKQLTHKEIYESLKQCCLSA